MAYRSLVTAPGAEPVSVAEFKTHSRVTITEDDTDIAGKITSARQWVEEFLWRKLIDQTWDFLLDGFPLADRCNPAGDLVIPFAPLDSVTEFEYNAPSDGTPTAVDSSVFSVVAPAGPDCERGHIRRKYGQTWPSPRSEQNTVRVRAVVGYGASGTDVPEPIRQAIMQITASQYEFRETMIVGSIAKVPDSAERLLRQFRLKEIV